jgi:hypothetical protein
MEVRFNRSVCVALKAVNTDSGINVAAVAEMFLTVGARRVFCVADVAGNTFLQAVLPGAYTFMHGRITLLEDVLHVVDAHLSGRRDAALFRAETTLGHGNDRTQCVFIRRHISSCAWRVHTKQQAE